MINNCNGTYRDETLQRLTLRSDTGGWIKYVFLADIAGQCRKDVYAQMVGGTDISIYFDDGQQHYQQKTIDLPNAFGTPLPVRMGRFGRVSFLSTGGDGFYLVPATTAEQCTTAKFAHDFDGDAKSDILWRNSRGSNAIWFMNGGIGKLGVFDRRRCG